MAIEFICNDIMQRLAAGETVNVRGFGVFKAKNMEARQIRNPQTQEVSEAPATVRVLFTAAKSMKLGIKKGRGLPLTEAEEAQLAKLLTEGGDEADADEAAEE